jgi:hypothetical protein
LIRGNYRKLAKIERPSSLVETTRASSPVDMRRSAVYARPDGDDTDDETEGLNASGDGVSTRRAWRTRTSRMETLQEPVPTGVVVGFFCAGVLFVLVKLLQGYLWGDGDEVI